MALIALGITPCRLCGETLTANDVILGFPDSVGYTFMEFADSAVHVRCFQAWDKRIEFVQAFNATEPYQKLREDGTYIR